MGEKGSACKCLQQVGRTFVLPQYRVDSHEHHHPLGTRTLNISQISPREGVLQVPLRGVCRGMRICMQRLHK